MSNKIYKDHIVEGQTCISKCNATVQWSIDQLEYYLFTLFHLHNKNNQRSRLYNFIGVAYSQSLCCLTYALNFLNSKLAEYIHEPNPSTNLYTPAIAGKFSSTCCKNVLPPPIQTVACVLLTAIPTLAWALPWHRTLFGCHIDNLIFFAMIACAAIARVFVPVINVRDCAHCHWVACLGGVNDSHWKIERGGWCLGLSWSPCLNYTQQSNKS